VNELKEFESILVKTLISRTSSDQFFRPCLIDPALPFFIIGSKYYTSFCVRRSSFWVKTQAPSQTTFVLSKCNKWWCI